MIATFPGKFLNNAKPNNKYTNILPHKMTFYVSFTVKYLSTKLFSVKGIGFMFYMEYELSYKTLQYL